MEMRNDDRYLLEWSALEAGGPVVLGFSPAQMVARMACGLMLACALVAAGTLLGLGELSVVMCALPLGLGFPVLLRIRSQLLALLLGALVSGLLLWVCWAAADLSVPSELSSWLSGFVWMRASPLVAWQALVPLVTLASFSVGSLLAAVEGSRLDLK